MNEIRLKLTIPKSYRREFHLTVDGIRHRIEVRGGVIQAFHNENDSPETPEQISRVVDWIEECVMSVRREFE